ncbi:hypothetical protein [Nonomuraea roseoviolacea]|uniref:YtxH domain-containing protein n=1 Tax=Nonomuraea roseoviolacea subsp. carminata TaxID=160689 RepID=A0ABT1K8Z9_9ACTN|nr:hypothetical protein [Nonomuraea roseoviolacea]MCP2350475.1 hypothetical protein [Nonomuraea roseoviolacea subsp. carminata]
MTYLHDYVDAIKMAVVVKRTLQETALDWADPRLESVVRAQSRPIVEVRRISMNSPLTMELLVGGASSLGVTSAVVYLFKNPSKLGEWWPKLQASWYDARAEAEKAKQAYEALVSARTEIEELER